MLREAEYLTHLAQSVTLQLMCVHISVMNCAADEWLTTFKHTISIITAFFFFLWPFALVMISYSHRNTDGFFLCLQYLLFSSTYDNVLSTASYCIHISYLILYCSHGSHLQIHIHYGNLDRCVLRKQLSYFFLILTTPVTVRLRQICETTSVI